MHPSIIPEPTDTSQALKRVASDGTQRGIASLGKKNKVKKLIIAMREAVEKDTGIKNWDPMVQLAVISARAFQGYPATDPTGKAILDENKEQVYITPDPELAAATAAKIAPYVYQALRPKDAVDDSKAGTDPEDKKQAIIAAMQSMGVPIENDEG